MKSFLVIGSRIISYLLFFALCLFVAARTGYGVGGYPISAFDWGNGCGRIVFVLPWALNLLILGAICFICFRYLRSVTSASWATLAFVPLAALPVAIYFELLYESDCPPAFSYKLPPISLFDANFHRYKSATAVDIFERAKTNSLTEKELNDYQCHYPFTAGGMEFSGEISLKEGFNIDYVERARIGNVIGELDLPENWYESIPIELKTTWCRYR